MTAEERLKQLNQVLQQCREAPFYRNRIPDRPLAALEEVKQLPLTTKEDLRRASPFDLVSVPREDLYQYHESFGTTGVPVSTWLTRDDLLHSARQLNSGGLNLSSDDLVLIRFPYAISLIAHIVHDAARRRQSCVVAASSRNTITPFPRVVDLMQKLGVTVLAGMPLQAQLIAETAKMLGYNPAADFPSLRAILTAGELLTDTRRKWLQETWGVPVFNNYGMTEIGSALTDCAFGRPHPQDDYFIFELLSNDLKTEVPPGEIGLLVVTTLKKRGTPLVRFLTEDRARLIREECPCGRSLSLIIHGRQQDVIKINGRQLDRWDLEEMVSYLPGARFWAAGPGRSGLKLVVEAEQGEEKINWELVRQLEEKCRVPLEVEFVPAGVLYDRAQLLAVGEVGKPRCIYTAEEMEQKAYLKSTRL